MKPILRFVLALSLAAPFTSAEDPWVVYEGRGGPEAPGAGKHIVLLAGDEEYRSEEALPMLARILAAHHGFKCTVNFSTNPETGEIDPESQTNVRGLEVLSDADLVVCFYRFRELPDAEMKHFVDYVESGKPLIGIRTATHAFSYSRKKESVYAKWDWRSTEWPGGFGQQILGDTWISHHGHHGKEATRGIIEPENADHPILRGVEDVWGPTDVYGLRNLPDDATVLLRGQVVAGMEPSSPPVEGPKNEPLVPVTWTREIDVNGTTQRIMTTTIGAAVDFENEGLRRAFVNACYWGMGLEGAIPEKSQVDYVGDYDPTFYGFGTHKRGVMPSDHAW